MALDTPAGRRWVTAVRAYRVTTTGSVEQIVMTTKGFVLTQPTSTAQNISIIYANASGAFTQGVEKSPKTASLFP